MKTTSHPLPHTPSSTVLTNSMAFASGATSENRPHTASCRFVLFATVLAGADIPVPENTPAALLPLRHSTVIESQIEQMALCGVREIDLVVCDSPESIRALLGDGSQWGVQLHWHLVKDAAHPYEILRSLDVHDTQFLVMGHSSHWVSAQVIQSLMHKAQMPLYTCPERGLQWSHWACMETQKFDLFPPGCELNSLSTWLENLPATLLDSHDIAALTHAGALLQHQFNRVQEGAAEAVAQDFWCPAHWIRTPWGAMSAQAHVGAGARIMGPVWIGPGCVIESGAVLRPRVVLTRNVVVAAHCQLADAVVFPETYLGAGLNIENALVNGTRLRHVSHGVELNLPEQDGLLLHLQKRHQEAGDHSLVKPAAWERLGALLLWLICAPLLGMQLLAQRGGWSAPVWTLQRSVAGWDEARQTLNYVHVRMACAGNTRWQNHIARMAGLLDIVQGQRSWFGARPRSASQWYAFHPQWQQILSRTPIGLFHAPMWSDAPQWQAEACAAADVYAAVQRRHGTARIFMGS